MFKKLSFVFFGLVACIDLAGTRFAEAQPLTWKNFSSMYYVNGICVVQGKVWAATSGGVFSYSPQSGGFDEFTTTEGLSNIQATSIAVEPARNAVVVGEGNGAIDELDASSGKLLRSQHDIANSAPLRKAVTKLSISGDTLFACAQFGVVVISLSTFNVLNNYLHFVPAQPSVEANGAAVFNGRIYVASKYGLSIAPQSGANLSAPDLWQVNNDSAFGNGVNGLAVFHGTLFIGTVQGLYFSNDGTTFPQLTALGNAIVNSLSAGNNLLLINSQNGLFKMDLNDSLSTVYNAGGAFNDAAAYSDGSIFTATANGLDSIVSNSNSKNIPPPGPATNTISNLSVDESGNLWCSTSLNDVGVAFMRYDYGTSKWRNYSIAQDTILPCNNFFEISAVCGNMIVAGAWGGLAPEKNGYHGGMVLLTGDSITNVFNSSNSTLVGFSGNTLDILVGAAACDQSGNIWVVNDGAYNNDLFDEYTPQTGTWRSFANSGSPTLGVSVLAIDAFGGLWAGSAYEYTNGAYAGLSYFNPANKESEILTASNGLLSNQINALLVDNENYLWIGTSAGLNVNYDPSNFSVSKIYSMLDQNITGIGYDALDDKWISSATGIYVLSPDGNTRLAQYDMTNSPLPSTLVNSVACDRLHGIVYFATQYGITRLKMGSVQPQDNFTQLKIFPNPVKFPLKQQIQIQGLVANSSIKIFSISGKLVKELQAQGGNIAYWDGTDDGGDLVSSGVYIVLAYSSDGSQSVVGKVAVVR